MNAYEKFCREIGNLMDWGTEDGSITTSCWQVVYFKMKYSHETEWSYEIEPFIWHYGEYCDFPMDWWEGEQDIELLAVYSLDYIVKEHYGGNSDE